MNPGDLVKWRGAGSLQYGRVTVVGKMGTVAVIKYPGEKPDRFPRKVRLVGGKTAYDRGLRLITDAERAALLGAGYLKETA